METTHLKVTGMNCGACVNHVTGALQSVPGVQSARVDLAAGSAAVQHQAGTTASQLIEAVTAEGYAAQVMDAAP